MKTTYDRIITDIQESYDLAMKSVGLSEEQRMCIRNTVSDAIVNNIEFEDQHILATGNPADGFDFYGPFDGVEDAMGFAESGTRLAEEYWCVPLKTEKEIGTPRGRKDK